jgi:hypothetical protein
MGRTKNAKTSSKTTASSKPTNRTRATTTKQPKQPEPIPEMVDLTTSAPSTTPATTPAAPQTFALAYKVFLDTDRLIASATKMWIFGEFNFHQFWANTLKSVYDLGGDNSQLLSSQAIVRRGPK